MKKLIMFGFILLLFSCSTKQINIKPEQNLKDINQNIKVSVKGKTINKNLLADLDRYLKAQLIIAGFNPMQNEMDCINLFINVETYSPGNQAARIIFGLGAGRGSLIYTAQFTDQSGKILASMTGKERFTGGEIGFNQKYGGAATLGGADKVQAVLCQEAAKHIVELATNSIVEVD